METEVQKPDENEEPGTEESCDTAAAAAAA
jgi:hypothetical protein